MDLLPEKTFIIAEAGVNHNGDLTTALKLVDAACETGADAVKFQTWKTELIVTRDCLMADYQVSASGDNSQYDMLKSLELSYSDFETIKKYCDERGILFLSTPDEETSAAFLEALVPIFKIGSGELNNTPYLRYIAQFDKPVILSTGMASLEEVQEAVKAMLDKGLDTQKLSLLHANTAYPTPDCDVNLYAMATLMESFPDITIGLSDHSEGVTAAIAAVAMGARIIEKHFTLSKDMDGPDHSASLEPEELKLMVEQIRRTESMLGSSKKTPTPSEKGNMDVVRKKVVARRSIAAGEEFSSENLHCLRVGGGVSAAKWDCLLGRQSRARYSCGDVIAEAELEGDGSI